MKKVLYSIAFAALVMAACTKEADFVEKTPVTEVSARLVTISANISDETRSVYENGKTFSWSAKDTVFVFCLQTGTEYGTFRPFSCSTDGNPATFTGEIPDGYELGTYAYFVNDWIVDDSGNLLLQINNSSYSDGTKATNLPLLGLADDTDPTKFSFASLGAFLKLNLTSIPESATMVLVETAKDSGEKLRGYFTTDSETGLFTTAGGVGDVVFNGKTYSNLSYNYSYAEFTRDSDGTATVYVPVPTGTISAGAEISLAYSDEDGYIYPIITRATSKDITVGRNQVLSLGTFKGEYDWKNVGTGKYKDAFIWTNGFSKKTDYIDVEIQQREDDPKIFRVVNPYGTARTAFNYSINTGIASSDYLEIRLLEKGSTVYGEDVDLDGYVYYGGQNTNVLCRNTMKQFFFYHPQYFNYAYGYSLDWTRNFVTEYQADGKTPANLHLNPIYLSGSSYWPGYVPSDDNAVITNIFFPGVDVNEVDLACSVSYLKMEEEDPEQAVVSASISLSSEFESAKLVAATDAAAAKAAIEANQNVTAVTESANSVLVKLPANAPSGDYYVFAKLQAKSQYTEAVSGLIKSDVFTYTNYDEDFGYSVNDIIGQWSRETDEEHGNLYHVFPKGEDWDEENPFLFEIEALGSSDDPLLGNVLITALGKIWYQEEDPEDSSNTLNKFGFFATDYKVYASFDTATGLLTIPSYTPFFDMAEQDGIQYDLTLVPATLNGTSISFGSTEDVVFKYNGEDGSLTFINSCPIIAACTIKYDTTQDDSEYQLNGYWDIWQDSNSKLIMEKATASSTSGFGTLSVKEFATRNRPNLFDARLSHQVEREAHHTTPVDNKSDNVDREKPVVFNTGAPFITDAPAAKMRISSTALPVGRDNMTIKVK